MSLKKCRGCKENKSTKVYVVNKSYKDGRISICNTCANEYNKQYRAKNKDKVRKYYRTYRKINRQKPNILYIDTKARAKRCGHKFILTFKQFMNFWQQPCSYCGSPIKTIGLDRVNTKKGYISNNIVSCCAMCNRMKLDHTVNAFMKQCENIIKYTKEQR